MNKKRILAAIAAMAVITAGASAQNIIVDDVTVSDAAYTADEKLMLPLRSLCEALDYTVEWDAETRGISLTKGAHYITMNIDVDGYTFARTAPMPLGTAPTLSAEGVTFVPANFVDEILKLEYSVAENGDVVIKTAVEETNEKIMEEITEAVAITGTASITEIGENSITIEDDERGEVILNISEETEILGADGEAITAADLKEGDSITVEYSEPMTLSLPPQNTPVKIQITEIPEIQTAELEGEIRAFEDGKILVGGENPTEQTALVTGEETIITDAEGNEITLDDLKVGDKIKAVHVQAMTFSIPPQTSAIEITVVK